MSQVSMLRQKAERLHYLANVRVKPEHAEALHEEAGILDQRADDLEAQDGAGVNTASTGPPANATARLDARPRDESRMGPERLTLRSLVRFPVERAITIKY